MANTRQIKRPTKYARYERFAAPRRDLFKLDAPEGHYPLLDAHISRLLKRRQLTAKIVNPFRWYRQAVIVAGNTAATAPTRFFADREKWIELRETLSAFQKATEALLTLKRRWSKRGAKLASFKHPILLRIAAEYFGPPAEIDELLKYLDLNSEDITDFKNGISRHTATSGNTDLVANEFVAAMAVSWYELTGTFPPRSRTGPFVRMVDDAWSALGWAEHAKRASLSQIILHTVATEDWAYSNLPIFPYERE